jgi:hypothetical protein
MTLQREYGGERSEGGQGAFSQSITRLTGSQAIERRYGIVPERRAHNSAVQLNRGSVRAGRSPEGLPYDLTIACVRTGLCDSGHPAAKFAGGFQQSKRLSCRMVTCKALL